MLNLESIRTELRTRYPTLNTFRNADGLVEIAGVFIVRGTSGEELDRYDVSIVLPLGFPNDLPVVREVGGRIPWHEDRHVEFDGKTCVMLPDDRWRCFPEGSSIIDFIDVPVANYFLSQSYFEEHGEWPLGEWGHGMVGVIEFYKWLIGTESDITMYRFLYVLSKQSLKRHLDCPCGSGKKIKELLSVQDRRPAIENPVAHGTAARSVLPNQQALSGVALARDLMRFQAQPRCLG